MLKAIRINAGIQDFTLSDNGITKEGVDAIHSLLCEHSLPIPALGEVDTVWVNRRGTYPKRLAKWARTQYNETIPQGILSRIGQIAAENTNRQATYRIDATTDFDWYAGEFGDAGSCYWGGRSDAKIMIADGGGFAVRFFTEDGDGLGRCWALPQTHDGDPILLIWNQYHKAGKELLHTARVVSAIEGLSYRKVTLCNNGDSTGTLWINGGMGYVIGPDSVVNGIEEWDLRLEEPEGEECAYCGRRIGEDDDRYEVDGETWCERCTENSAYYCDRCEEYSRHSTTTVDGEEWCRDCRDAHATCCEHCEKYTRVEDTVSVGDQTWCSSCAEDTSECDKCGDRFADGDLDRVDGEYWCEDCRDGEDLQECEHCEGSTALPTRRVDGEHWCQACFDSHPLHWCDSCEGWVSKWAIGEPCSQCGQLPLLQAA